MSPEQKYNLTCRPTVKSTLVVPNNKLPGTSQLHSFSQVARRRRPCCRKLFDVVWFCLPVHYFLEVELQCGQ